jgi:hypothetical protein
MTGSIESRWARAAQVIADDLRELASALERGEVRGIAIIYLEDRAIQKPIIDADTPDNQRRIQRLLIPKTRET